MKFIQNWLILFLCLVAVGLSACSGAGAALPTPTLVDVAAIQTVAVQTYVADLTHRAPTETPIPTPTPTQMPSITPTMTPTSTPTATRASSMYPAGELMKDHVAYYLVDPIESVTDCKYNMVPFLVYPLLKRTGNYQEDITAALTVLFRNSAESYDRFANPVSKSDLRVTDYIVSGITLNIYLAGTLHRNFSYPMAFEYSKFCPDKQTRDQIFKTVGQFNDLLVGNGITDLVIWYYNDLLDDLLLNDFPANP